MKILLVINSLNGGGAEKIIVEFTRRLFRIKDIEVKFLVLSSKRAVYLNALVDADIDVMFLGKNEYNPWLIVKMIPIISQFDIVHVHLFPAQYFVGLASFLSRHRKKPALIFTEHSSHNKRLGKPYLRWLEKWIYFRYGSVIAVSQSVKNKVCSWINHRNIVKIPNGIPIDSISVAPIYSKVELAAQFGIPEGAKLMLMAARFEFPKRQDLLVQVLGLLPGNYHLLLAGSGTNESHVNAVALRNGVAERVRFLGFRDDIYSLMKSVDINVLWSDYEGMSGVVLEAMMAGKPYLGSDVEGINDIIPASDFLFDSLADLAAKVRILCENQAEAANCVEIGRRYAADYHLDIMVKRHVELYKSHIN